MMATNPRRATLADVASRAGVTSVTVPRALRNPDLVSDALRLRVASARAYAERRYRKRDGPYGASSGSRRAFRISSAANSPRIGASVIPEWVTAR
jgi:hypothetical protein